MNTLDSLNPEWMQIPSDFIIPEKRLKRKPGPVDLSVLDESQTQAVEQLIDYIEGKSTHAMYVVTGWAGCGKTFLISRFIEWLLYAKKKKVAVTAPTNKAVDVIREMSEVEDVKLTFSTIHKLLALKESYDFHGRLTFKPDNSVVPSIVDVEVLIIDETSMLDDELCKLILPYVKDQDLKLIFVGDPAQIPPINRIDCIPFLPAKQRQLNMGAISLTHMHRQAMDNPILSFATEVRENLNTPLSELELSTNIVNNSGIIVLDKDAHKLDIYAICDRYFVNEIFKEYSDFMKVIAWRNITVNAINNKVRQLIYKAERLPSIMVGEKLLANQPIKDQRGFIVFSVNAEFEVLTFEIRTTPLVVYVEGTLAHRQQVKYYDCKVMGTQVSNKKSYNKSVPIWIVHEDSLKEYMNGMETVKREVLKLQGYARFGGWKSYYAALAAFADVKYNYAITSHKSQGSSYESCMMLDWDMHLNPKVQEKNRIRYVSITRARKYLFTVI